MLGERAATARERDDRFDAELRGLLLRYLQDLASRLGDRAELRFVDDARPVGDGVVAEESNANWALLPSDGRAAAFRWIVGDSDAYNTYLGLGRYTWVHVLTVPKRQWPDEAAAEVARIVEALVAGRFREEAWYRRGSGELVNSLGGIRYADDRRWHTIGEISRPLPILRERRFAHRTWEYAPYGEPMRAVGEPIR